MINASNLVTLNQNSNERTKYIINKENINFTINSFSEFLAIVINALIGNKI